MFSNNRKYIIQFFIILVGIVYLIRLLYMQVIDESWALRAQEIAEKRKLITPPRGVMYDRNGVKIVSNKTYYNLMMVEADITHLDTNKLAKILNWTPQQVKNRFYEIRKGEGTYYNKHTRKRSSNYQKVRPYPFVKELTPEEIVKILPHLDDFPGFYEEVTDMRVYPYPNAANILGYCAEVIQEEIKEDKFYRPGDNIGRTGIEKVYEKELRGKKGVHYIVTSALNNVIEPYAGGKFDTIAKQGPALKLGIDIELQAYGELLMKNKRGSITAIEPKTGEILAMISAPSYDPNLFIGKKNLSKNYPALVNDPDKPLYPRPLAAEYPPGSSLKLIQALIGLQEGVINITSGFPCNKALVGCHNHPTASDVVKAVQYSCNPYFYYTVRRIIQKGRNKNFFKDAELGLNVWADYMNSFGLGVKFETDIFGLRAGLIPNSKFYDKWYGHNTWAFSTIRSISIGQGEVKITPLQMANIAAIIANKGWFYTPHFVKKIGDDYAKREFLKKHITKVKSIHFDPIIEGMRRVVNESGGTGSRARMKDIIICGKTGTVQNSQGEDHSVFIAFAPMDNPKIAISVIVENAGWGGTWATPIAQLMIEKYLKRIIKDKLKEKNIIESNLLNVKKKKDKYAIH